MASCAPVRDASLRGETVLDGRVLDRRGTPIGRAYVRLLDETGEFTAEVVTGEDGRFRFFAAPGEWIVRVIAAGLPDTRLRPDAPGLHTCIVGGAA